MNNMKFFAGVALIVSSLISIPKTMALDFKPKLISKLKKSGDVQLSRDSKYLLVSTFRDSNTHSLVEKYNITDNGINFYSDFQYDPSDYQYELGNSATISSDNKYIGIFDSHHPDYATFNLLNADNLEKITNIKLHEYNDSNVKDVEISSNSKYILVNKSYWKNHPDIYNIKNKEKLPIFSGQEKYPFVVMFSPDGEHVLKIYCKTEENSYSKCNRTLEFVKLDNLQKVFELDFDKYGNVYKESLFFSSDKKNLMFFSSNNIVKIDLTNGHEVSKIQIDSAGEEIIEKGFSSDGKYLLISPNRGAHVADVLKLIDTSTGLSKIEIYNDFETIFSQLSDDSKYIVSAEGSAESDRISKIKVTHVDSKTQYILPSMTNNSGNIIISPNSKLLATDDEDSVKIFNIATGKEIFEITFDDSITKIQFSSDSKYIIAGSSSGYYKVYKLYN